MNDKKLIINKQELRLKPDTVGLVTAFSMMFSSLFFPIFDLPIKAPIYIGGIIAVIGLVMVQVAGASFKKSRTTVDPLNPARATSLITTGPYRFTRNPIYLGMALILLGWAVFLMNILAFAFVIAFVVYINRFQIIPEERTLLAIFGSKYASYNAKVHKWI